MNDRDETPLITFAVFAYNQEKFVREAIQAAFAQDYPRLEIILSDDCSTDSTFEIMREMLSSYEGSHTVVLNKNQNNMGTFPHFLSIARKARGTLMICSSGDDVSYSQRTQSIVSDWIGNNAGCICSKHDEIDEKSKLIREDVTPNGDENTVWQYFSVKQPRQFCHGQSAAYSTDFLSLLPDTSQRIFNEDMITTLLAHATGSGVNFINSSLMAYRKHESYSNRTTNKSTFREAINSVNMHANFASAQHEMVTYIRSIASDIVSDKPIDCILDFEYMAKLERKTYIECNATKANFIKRLGLLCSVQSFDEFRTVLPRLFGVTVYAVMRSSYTRMSKIF